MDGELLTAGDFETELFSDEPTIADWKLAQALDLRLNLFHELTERNRPDLEDFGNLTYRKSNSAGPGRPGREYRYNFNQAIYIINRSEAKNAKAVQKHVVIIYGLWATGKLKPVDEAAALVVAQATTQAYQQSTDLIGMLQGLLAQMAELATHNDASEIGDKVESVRRLGRELQEQLHQHLARSTAEILTSVRDNAPTPRRPALSAVQELHDHVIRKYYDGYCPICDAKQYRIIDDEGKHTKLYHHDHWTGNKSKRGTYEMIPVCQTHNYAFENKGARTSPRVKIKVELFFDYVREEEGQLKFGGLHGR